MGLAREEREVLLDVLRASAAGVMPPVLPQEHTSASSVVPKAHAHAHMRAHTSQQVAHGARVRSVENAMSPLPPAATARGARRRVVPPWLSAQYPSGDGELEGDGDDLQGGQNGRDGGCGGRSGGEGGHRREKIARMRVNYGQVKLAIEKTQEQLGYKATEMPSVAHMCQAGFTHEALAVTYDFGGRDALAVRLGLDSVADADAAGRFAEWEVVEKAVRRAATAIQVQEHRSVMARRAPKGVRRDPKDAPRNTARIKTGTSQHERGGIKDEAAVLRMPTGTQLRAQGMELVDKAIREVHGGYNTVALKLGLALPGGHPATTRQPHRHLGVSNTPMPAGMPRSDTPMSTPCPTHSSKARIGANSKAALAPPLWGGRAFQSSIPPLKDPVHYEDLKNLRLTIEELVRQQSVQVGTVSGKNAMRWMPTEKQLRDNGLEDALFAIKLRHGGMHQVARKLGLRLQGPACRSARALCAA